MNLRIKKKKEKQKLDECWEAVLGPEPQLLAHEHRRKARIQVQKKYPVTYELRFHEDGHMDLCREGETLYEYAY